MELTELNKLKNQFYLLEENRGIYCSKCGKKILRDTYHYAQHEKSCNVKFVDKYNPNKNKEIYGFSFRIIDDMLVFNVYNLMLELEPGFNDRYKGSKWKSIFVAKFQRDSREVFEKGLYNVDIWLKKMIDTDGIICLNKYDYMKVINEFYSSLYQIYNLGMFLDLYRQKGYKQSSLTKEDVENIDDIPFTELEYYKENRSRMGYGSIVCVCNAINIKNEVVLQCSLYERNSIVEFEMEKRNILPFNTIFISKDFVYSKNEFYYENLFNINFFKYNNMKLFIERYPELMVQKYLDNGGKNIFKIILSSNYNKIIELTAKAGLTYFSDNFDLIKDKINIYANNIKEIFGLPIKIVKALNSYDGIEYILNKDDRESLISAYEKYPVIFEDVLTITQLSFLSDYGKKDLHMNRCYKEFSDKEMLKTVRYLKNNEAFTNAYVYRYYKDYLDMCVRHGKFICGKNPKDVFTAHNLIDEVIQIEANRLLQEDFKAAVENKEYQKLASSYIKEGEKKPDIESEVYEIIVPKHYKDLIEESAQLHHCVKTYIEKVSEGYTYILFLRKKDEPDKSLATIEVLPDKRLIQLKAYCNSKAEKSAQTYVKKWAKAKGITIDSYDFN